MTILNTSRFNADLKSVEQSASAIKGTVQNLLVTACYHVAAHGNTDPINRILKSAQNGKTVDVTRITKWVVLHAGCALLREGIFVVNEKACKELNVTSEETFAMFEAHLRSLNWTDITGKTPATNPWDIENYLASVLKSLDTHAKDEKTTEAQKDAIAMVVKEVTAVKGAVAQKLMA